MDVTKTMANKAATDLSDKDGYCAIFDSGMNVASAITDQVVGIFTKGGDDSVLLSDVCLFGECRAIAGGTVTAGNMLTPHSDGTVIDTTASSCQEFALALESGVAGDWVSIFVIGAAKTHS